jgi:hypothetical protein
LKKRIRNSLLERKDLMGILAPLQRETQNLFIELEKKKKEISGFKYNFKF